jgi:hypothetical protein
MYICPRLCTTKELFELDAPVASPFTMESVGASVVGVRASEATSPEETSGETEAAESDSEAEEDWRSAVKRGEALKLKRRTSNMIGGMTKRENRMMETRGAVMMGEGSGAPL